MFLNSDIDLLDLIKLGNLFKIKDPRKCTELVLKIEDLAGGVKSTGSRLKLYGISLYLTYNHINGEISVDKSRKCHWSSDTLLLK